MLSQEARGHARERGGVGPCGEEFSYGLIFFLLRFFSFKPALMRGKSGPALMQGNSGEKK